MGGFGFPNPSGSGYAPEPLEGNSLTRALRSLTNTTGGNIASMYNQGQETLGQAKQAFSQLSQPLDYWKTLLGGNRAEMSATLAPEISRIASGYTQANKVLSQFLPSGGGRSQLLASAPFRQAQDVSTLFQTVRPEAAKQTASILQNLGTALAQIGLNEHQISNVLAQLTGNALLGVRGQDVTERGQTMGLAGQMAGAGVNLASLLI